MDPSREPNGRVEIATILNNLGAISLWRGELDNARERLEQSHRVWQSVAGPTSPAVVKSMTNVALAYMRAKRYDDAAAWLAGAASAGRQAFGETHPFTVKVHEFHAKALRKAGRKPEAKEVARTAEAARNAMSVPSTSAYTVDYKDLMNER
jgi:hypothetical protein